VDRDFSLPLEAHMTSFHIDSQSDGVFNNVGRDQHVHGGQTWAGGAGEDMAIAIRDLRAALVAAGLPGAMHDRAEREVDMVEQQVNATEPDRSAAAGAHRRLTGLLVAAAPVATATASLVEPVQTLAGWLGAAGAGVLKMLSALG
jgi:hypothetical protein